MSPTQSDEDRPFTKSELARFARTRPNVRAIRRRLRMSQAEFAAAFGFNVATLRDWEQGRSIPDQAIRSYLRVIATQPEIVRKALEVA